MSDARSDDVVVCTGPGIKLAMERLLKDELPEKAVCMAILMESGDSVAYFGAGEWDGHNLNIYVAGDGPKPPLRLGWKIGLEYCFETCGATRITSLVDESNTHAQRMNRIFGLHKEGVIRKGNRDTGEDIHLYGFTDEDYQGYLEKKRGK